MSVNSNNRFSTRDNKSKQSANIRKSILRNPEVPIRDYNQSSKIIESSKQLRVSFPQAVERYGGQSYHQPKCNTINQLCKNMNEINMNEPIKLETLADLSQDSRYVANREITSKLNYASHQTIYKNLTKLDFNEIAVDDARKARSLIQKTARKVADKSSLQKSQEIREEISSLINELVDLEYKEANKALEAAPKLLQLPSEEDYLGFTKFSSPKILLPNKRTETQRFLDRLDEEVERELSAELNRETQPWISAERHPSSNQVAHTENCCKCLREFYNQHSTCS